MIGSIRREKIITLLFKGIIRIEKETYKVLLIDIAALRNAAVKQAWFSAMSDDWLRMLVMQKV